VAVKAGGGSTDIEGDRFLLQYVDVVGYLFNKLPMIRNTDIQWEAPSVFEKLSPELIQEIEATTEPFPEEIKKQNETID
jgi:hypothetical protein